MTFYYRQQLIFQETFYKLSNCLLATALLMALNFKQQFILQMTFFHIRLD